jgi:hypothetical protein
LHAAIADGHEVAGLQIIIEGRVLDDKTVRRAGRVTTRDQEYLRVALKSDFSGKRGRPHLGSWEIDNDRDRLASGVGFLPNRLDETTLRVNGSVRKRHACDVETGIEQPAENLR